MARLRNESNNGTVERNAKRRRVNRPSNRIRVNNGRNVPYGAEVNATVRTDSKLKRTVDKLFQAMSSGFKKKTSKALDNLVAKATQNNQSRKMLLYVFGSIGSLTMALYLFFQKGKVNINAVNFWATTFASNVKYVSDKTTPALMNALLSDTVAKLVVRYGASWMYAKRVPYLGRKKRFHLVAPVVFQHAIVPRVKGIQAAQQTMISAWKYVVAPSVKAIAAPVSMSLSQRTLGKFYDGVRFLSTVSTGRDPSDYMIGHVFVWYNFLISYLGLLSMEMFFKSGVIQWTKEYASGKISDVKQMALGVIGTTNLSSIEYADPANMNARK